MIPENDALGGAGGVGEGAAPSRKNGGRREVERGEDDREEEHEEENATHVQNNQVRKDDVEIG